MFEDLVLRLLLLLLVLLLLLPDVGDEDEEVV